MSAKNRVQHPDYTEEATIVDLHNTALKTAEEMDSNFDKTSDYAYMEETISIIIGGKCFEFILGGPQMQALNDFIDTIAEENGYDIP